MSTTTWAVGAAILLFLLSQNRAIRTATPFVPAISRGEADRLFTDRVARWHDFAARAEQVTAALPTIPTVPADIILTQIKHESAGDPNADHSGREHGLGGFTRTAVEDVMVNVIEGLPISSFPVEVRRYVNSIGDSFDPARASNMGDVLQIALYTGLLKKRFETWLGALEAYRCGPDRSAPVGNCHEEARTRLRDVNREPNLSGDPHR